MACPGRRPARLYRPGARGNRLHGWLLRSCRAAARFARLQGHTVAGQSAGLAEEGVAQGGEGGEGGDAERGDDEKDG